MLSCLSSIQYCDCGDDTTGPSLAISRLSMCTLLVESAVEVGIVATGIITNKVDPFALDSSFVTRYTPISETNETSVNRVNA